VKILFSNPPWWETQEWHRLRRLYRQGVRCGSRWPFTYLGRSSPDKFVHGDYLPYPFFMGYASSYVARETGAEVQLRDSIGLKESYETYYACIEREKYDFIFIESATPSWEHDKKIIQRIHELSPHTKIVLTGPITSTQSQAILDQLPVAACIQGEYEKGSVKVVNGQTGILRHDLLTKEEMNNAPFPTFDFASTKNYYDPNPRGQAKPQAQVWSSRGCPFKCIFCVWPATMTGNDPDGNSVRTVRQYTPEYMEAFLKEIVAKYGFKTIYFDDDTFNLGNSHVLKMSEMMTRLALPWSAMCRADTIKRETWKVMKDAGCFGVKLGFESGSQRVVDTIVNKHLDLEEAGAVVYHLREIGMTVHGTFTYGLPGETKEEMKQTRRFIKSLPFNSVQESGTAEIEGTPLHTLRERGTLEKYNGAVVGKEYTRATDGNKKFQGLVKELKDA